MPLINLTTDLKSLQYGMDRPGGGSSNQPFLFSGFDVDVNINPPTINNPKGIGQNVFDIPTISNSPQSVLFSNTIGAPGTFYNPTFTLFKKDGIDLVSPVLNTLNSLIQGAADVTSNVANGAISLFNNVTDTSQTPNYPDFLWRKNRYNIAHSIVDAIRISKFLTTPAGIFFVLKQELLERQNPKLVNVNRVYLPTSTIAQAGVLSFGGHLNKQGIDTTEPSYYLGGTYGYFYSTKGLGATPAFQTLSGNIENRLTIAYTAKIAKQELGELTINPFGITRIAGDNILLSYPGGPGSILGIGNTNIRIQNPTIKRRDIYEDREVDSGKEIFDNPHNTSVLKSQFFVSHKSPTYLYNPNFTYDKISSTPGISFTFFKSIKDTVGEEPLNSNLFGEGYIDELLIRDNNNIADNLNIDKTDSVGADKRFQYGTNISDGIDKYLTPIGKAPIKYTPDDYLGSTNAFLSQSKDYPNSTEIKTDLLDQPPYINQKSKDSSGLSGGFLQYSTTSYKSNIERFKISTLGDTNGFNDFRNFTKGSGSILPVTDYTEFNRTKTYKTSNTTFKGNFLTGSHVLDPNTGISSDLIDNGNDDLINFTITTVNSLGTRTPIVFRAYLEDWNDNYKAEWNGIKYMGRAEQLYKYNGFSRDGSITFNVPVLSKLDLGKSYQKLNQLINTVAPFYSTATKSGAGVSGLLTGTITEVTMGDYWKKMPVLVNSISYTPISDMGWDIGRNVDGTARTNEQLPKGIKVSMNFTIVHNYTPQYGSDFIIN